MKNMQTETQTQRLDPEVWVDEYGDYLFRYALSRIHDPEFAEDLVQKTFLAALHAKEGFRGDSSERTWLTWILKYKNSRENAPLIGIQKKPSWIK